MNISFDYYKVFYYVAMYKSFSQAANALHLGQPNISKTIRKLEEQLGVKLFTRTGKTIALSHAGEVLFPYVKTAIENLQTATEKLESACSLDGGMLSIGTTEMSLYGSVATALSFFMKDYPSVKVRLVNYTTQQAIDALQHRSMDLIVVTNKPDDTEFTATPLRQYYEHLYCKVGTRLPYPILSIPDLTELPIISLHKGSTTYSLYQSFFSSFGVEFSPDIETTTISQALLLVSNGLGLAFVPDFIAEPFVESGSVERVPLVSEPPARHIMVIEDPRQHMSTPAKVFKMYLTREFQHR